MTPSPRFVVAAFFSLLTMGVFSFASCGGNSDSAQLPGTVPAPAPASTPQAQPSGTPSPTPSPTPTMTMTPTPFAFATGTYGGNGVEFTYHGNGSATIKFNCANGQVPAPIPVDSFGNFQAPGTYQSAAGPVPLGGYPVDKAYYYGIVDGNDLELYANYTDAAGTVTAIGPFAAHHGTSGTFTGICAD